MPLSSTELNNSASCPTDIVSVCMPLSLIILIRVPVVQWVIFLGDTLKMPVFGGQSQLKAAFPGIYKFVNTAAAKQYWDQFFGDFGNFV